MPVEWIVLLEAAGAEANRPISDEGVRNLLWALDPGRYGAALCSRDRYAVQLSAAGATPIEALSDAVARWGDAVRGLGLPDWNLVRTEVFTPEELEQEFERAPGAQSSLHLLEPDPGPSERDQAGDELLHRAFSDPLTGLFGPSAFWHRVEAALVGQGSAPAVAVVRLDLDDFGRVNDEAGEATADQVLIVMAQRLAAMLRREDVLARLGGGEYGVLVADATEEGALAVAERMLRALRLPISISGHDFTFTASAGVAVRHPRDDAQAVADRAAGALSAAKAAGGGRAVLSGSGASVSAERRPHFTTAEVQDRVAHLHLLQRAAVAANEADTLHQAAQVVLRYLCSQLGCTLGHLWISPGAASGALPQSPLWHAAEAGDDRGLQEAAEHLLTARDGLRHRVLASGRPSWISDVASDEDVLPPALAAAAGLKSALAFPVLVGREAVAGLALFSRTPIDPTASFLQVLASIGIQLGRVVERQQADAARRRSETELREAHALARLGNWTFDVRSGDITWSPEMYALYGLDPNESRPGLERALAAVHPSDRSQVEMALSRAIETGERTADEIRIVWSDGQLRWHRCEVLPLRDESGAVVAIHGTSQDITERKLAEEALRERERQLTEAQRAARLGCWELELSGGRLTWSNEMYRLWGWDPGQEISLDAFLATVQPEDRQRLLEAGARLEQTGESSFVDFRATVADGRQRWFRGEAHMLFDEAGRAVKLFGTDQDITEQKQAEEELHRAKDLYQRIVETTREGIFILDPDDLITFVNSRMAQMLGYSVDAMTGMRASSLVDEETLVRLSGHQQRRREGMSEHYETRLLTRDGAVVHVLVSASPFLDDAGHYVGALALVTDVTALREAEEIVRSQSRHTQLALNEGELEESPPAS